MAPIAGSGVLSWPVNGEITQNSSWFHPGAIDIASAIGTPILAAESGTVTRVSVGTWDSGYGNNVNISGGEYATHYAHMSNVNVKVGDQVTIGKTVVGWVGITGRTTGPHLHFETKDNGQFVNPLTLL